ncbi:uncharacterized protein LOC143461293 [Clavelina lepadiformis]|uniref:uncharacterized protein LOC143461293 n=1 Tax=Clavelina lepadiformis TaxID=159417 RepID=UPI004042E81F
MNTVKMVYVIILMLQIKTACYARKLPKQVLDNISGGRSDASSMSTRRMYEIYSKVTGNFVQILGKKINANGKSRNKYTRIEVSSLSFGGKITIRGVESGRYICFSKRGKLIGKARHINQRCHFEEKIGSDYFVGYTNVKRPEWVIAFSGNGRPRRGKRRSKRRDEKKFLTYPLDSTPASTTSPSGVGEEVWIGFGEKIRLEIMKERTNRQQLGVTRHTVMSDGPYTPLSIVPPQKQKPTTILSPERRKVVENKLSRAQLIKDRQVVEPRYPPTVSALASHWPGVDDEKIPKKRKKNRRKQRKIKPKAETPTSVVEADFGIEPTRKNKKSRKRKSHRKNTTTIETLHEIPHTVPEPPTVPSALQLTITKPMKRTRKTSKMSRSRKSGSRKPSRHKNKRKRVT